MRKSSRKNDDAALILAGGIAAVLLGAAASSGWTWLNQKPYETGRAHRKRATRTTAWSFGAAGALGAAAAIALLGPRAVGEKDWSGAIDWFGDGVASLRKDVRKKIDKADLPRLELADLRKQLDRLTG